MIFRLRDFIRDPYPIWHLRRFLAESETWPAARLAAWRREKLQRTIRQALTRVPYYRDLAQEAGLRAEALQDFSDLAAFPFLTRTRIAEQFARLRADDAAAHRPQESATSGSTGTSMRFLLDRHANILEFAALWRVLNWAGYRFGQRYANLHGRVIPGDRLFEYDWRLNCLHLSSFNFKKENIRLYNERLRRFRPVLIKAYPSSIALFAQWLEEEKIEAYAPCAILTSSETLLDHQREILARVFRCPIHNFYGQNERAALISTCPAGRYHIHEEYSHVEILNPRGEPAAPGEAGEIVTTSFHNLAMPLIRYRTRDLAIPAATPCPCGRPYRCVEKVIGRIEDLVVTPDGRYVGRMDAAFKYSRGIRLSQIVQREAASMTVKIVRGAEYGPEDEAVLLREIRARVGAAIRIDLEYVDQIPVGANGKIKFVISSVAPQYQLNQDISA